MIKITKGTAIPIPVAMSVALPSLIACLYPSAASASEFSTAAPTALSCTLSSDIRRFVSTICETIV